jgi:glycosyltransferase involved in cell wall biosynthesis
VYVYCALTKNRFVVDAHSAAFQLSYWTRPRWLHGFLLRQAITTIVTNEYFQRLIKRGGGSAFVLRDIPTTFPTRDRFPLHEAFNVVVVNTFSDDEPLQEILEAAVELNDVQFHVTGKKTRASQELLAQAPSNVRFTDFLPDESYYGLLSSSQAVMCLTKRNHTMQRGACEALWLGKPIITSDWPLLQAYFQKGAVHVPNTAVGIREGVRELKQCLCRYQEEIRELQAAHRREWQRKLSTLNRLIAGKEWATATTQDTQHDLAKMSKL